MALYILLFLVAFIYLFIYFKAELCSNNICEVLNVQRTILVEGDLSMLFVSQHLAQNWVNIELGLDSSGFCFLACKTYRNIDSASSLGP